MADVSTIVAGSALASFLGGSAFRMVWGEASAYLTKYQDHKQELERMEKQEICDAASHARNMEGLRLQKDLEIKVIQNQVVVHELSKEDLQCLEIVNAPTGFSFIDAWNQVIRPGLATIAVFGLTAEAIQLGHMTEFHYEIAAAVLGMYVADRSLGKRGK